VRSFWWRRPQPYGLPPGLAPHAHHFALTELSTALQGMWQASDALWVNDIVRDAAAAHKPWQLELARQIGLSIPDTLITTDPDNARAFWEARGGEVVYKPFLQTYHSWRETRRLCEEDLALIDNVRLAPVIFQSLVPGVADLRVTVIGSEILAAAVNLERMEYKLDVRLNQQAYERHELPAAISEKLLLLMRRLGLEYGAIDLRLTPDGDYVFFEVNPAGQFLFVEHACGLPISAAMAAHLARGRGAGAAFQEESRAA
jgi:glutathione synthase/RimK-type ligase-like ATP-grasp enzyme